MESNTQAKDPAIKQGWARALVGLILYFIFNGIFQGLTFWAMMGITGLSVPGLQEAAMNPDAAYYGWITLALNGSGLVSTLLLIYMLRHWLDRAPMMDLGFKLQGHWMEIRQGLLVGAGLISAGFLSLYWTDNLTIEGVGFSLNQFLIAFIMMVFVAINEEVLVRGYLLSNLNVSVNKYLGLGITSVLFAVMHMLNPNWTWISMINIFLAGLVLGVYYIHRRNLWFPIALHFSWNFFQGPVAGFEVSGLNLHSIIRIQVEQSSWLTGGNFGFEGSILATILLIIAFIWLDRTYRPDPNSGSVQ